MRRSSTLAIIALVSLVASCQKPRPNQAVKVASVVAGAASVPQVSQTVTVTVTCPASDADPGGVTVQPWTVHDTVSSQQTAVTWSLHPDTLTVAIGYVDPNNWPFQPVLPKQASLKAQLNARARQAAKKGQTIAYPYRLTITCPNDRFIEIDPVVIVDP